MAYEPYASKEYYQNEYQGSIVPEDKLLKALRPGPADILIP